MTKFIELEPAGDVQSILALLGDDSDSCGKPTDGTVVAREDTPFLINELDRSMSCLMWATVRNKRGSPCSRVEPLTSSTR